MNLAQGGVDPDGLLFANFNQDSSSLAVGTQEGYRIYSLLDPSQLDQTYVYDGGDAWIVERLFSSCLVATVSMSCPRKLKIIHFKKGREIISYNYPDTVLAVRLNRSRVAVLLNNCIYIHNSSTIKVLHTIRDTPPNPNGICALSPNVENNYFAYPGRDSCGELQLFDVQNVVAHHTINAHEAPLAAITFNFTGTMVATAGSKGTVVRVFSTIEGTALMEFRRGFKRCVTIYSMAFSTDGRYLCASSNFESVHVFKLDQDSPAEGGAASAEVESTDGQDDRPQAQAQSWMGMLGSVVGAPSRLLPSNIGDALAPTRACNIARLPTAGHRTLCAIQSAVDGNPPRLMVASGDGHLYVFTVNPLTHDCVLYKEHKLRPDTTAQQPDPAEDEGLAGGLANVGRLGSHSAGPASAASSARSGAAASDSAAATAATGGHGHSPAATSAGYCDDDDEDDDLESLDTPAAGFGTLNLDEE